MIVPFTADLDAVEKATNTELPVLEYGGVSRLQIAADTLPNCSSLSLIREGGAPC